MPLERLLLEAASIRATLQSCTQMEPLLSWIGARISLFPAERFVFQIVRVDNLFLTLRYLLERFLACDRTRSAVFPFFLLF